MTSHSERFEVTIQANGSRAVDVLSNGQGYSVSIYDNEAGTHISIGIGKGYGIKIERELREHGCVLGTQPLMELVSSERDGLPDITYNQVKAVRSKEVVE